jgi:hypothetical protein
LTGVLHLAVTVIRRTLEDVTVAWSSFSAMMGENLVEALRTSSFAKLHV